jgi:hypothetical protein
MRKTYAEDLANDIKMLKTLKCRRHNAEDNNAEDLANYTINQVKYGRHNNAEDIICRRNNKDMLKTK